MKNSNKNVVTGMVTFKGVQVTEISMVTDAEKLAYKNSLREAIKNETKKGGITIALVRSMIQAEFDTGWETLLQLAKEFKGHEEMLEFDCLRVQCNKALDEMGIFKSLKTGGENGFPKVTKKLERKTVKKQVDSDGNEVKEKTYSEKAMQGKIKRAVASAEKELTKKIKGKATIKDFLTLIAHLGLGDIPTVENALNLRKAKLTKMEQKAS